MYIYFFFIIFNRSALLIGKKKVMLSVTVDIKPLTGEYH